MLLGQKKSRFCKDDLKNLIIIRQKDRNILQIQFALFQVQV